MLTVVNLNLPIDDELHRRLKVQAAARGVTLRELVRDSLDREADRLEAETAKRKR